MTISLSNLRTSCWPTHSKHPPMHNHLFLTNATRYSTRPKPAGRFSFPARIRYPRCWPFSTSLVRIRREITPSHSSPAPPATTETRSRFGWSRLSFTSCSAQCQLTVLPGISTLSLLIVRLPLLSLHSFQELRLSYCLTTGATGASRCYGYYPYFSSHPLCRKYEDE